MDTWMKWTGGVCCAAVACALLELLHPSGNMKKAARCITALFFLAAVVLPLPKWTAPDISTEVQTAQTKERADALEQLMLRQMAQSVSDQIEQTVADRLHAIGVSPRRVTAQVTVRTDQTTLDRLEIELDRRDRVYESTIRARMSDLLGVDPQLIYAE